jgi:hypothetical protein
MGRLDVKRLINNIDRVYIFITGNSSDINSAAASTAMRLVASLDWD